MVALNSWLEHWYPLCWSIVFLIEMCVGIAILCMARKEYKYDKEFNENIKAARHARRRKKYDEVIFQETNVGEMK